MKIALVSEHASPLAALGGVDAGGQNVHVAELSAALTRQRHEVTVYTRRDDPELPESTVAGAGYRVVHVPAGPAERIPKDDILPHLGDFARFLGDRWAAERPELVHAHFWMSGIAADSAARPLDLPVLLTFHALGTVKRRYQGLADTSPRTRIRLEGRVAARATGIIATCTDEVSELARMGVPRYRTSVVPCGVDLGAFGPEGPVAPRGRGHRLVSVGRMVRRKGFDTAIMALQELPETELVIAGGAPGDAGEAELTRLREVAADYGVADRVRFAGTVDRTEMPALLRSADAVLCTPWYEPFGIVPVEAMACGRPVVASAVGGLLDTVVDGVTGRLVPPRDPLALAAAMRELLADVALRERYGAAGLRRARHGYSWDRVAERTAAAYRAVVPARAAVDIASPTG